MSDYIVYKHTTPSDKVYIGITCQSPSRRWQKGRGYIKNEHFTRAIEKYGWKKIKHEILFDSLTKEQAEAKEIELIAVYKSNNPDFGYNSESGGNAHKKHSIETRKKMHEAQHGEKHHCFGKHPSQETIEKIRIANIGKKRTRESIEKQFAKIRGRQHSKATKAIMSQKALERVDNKKAILQLDKELNVICCYEGIRVAERTTGVNATQIVRCCKGAQKSAGGFLWKYAQEYQTGNKGNTDGENAGGENKEANNE